MMYSSSHAFLFLSWICLVLVCSHEFGYLCLWVNILMYYRFLLDNMLRSSQHFHLMVTTCSLKSLIYRIPLRLMLWGASYYTKILSPSCDKKFDIPTCPKSQLLEWKPILNGNPSYKFPAPCLPCYPRVVPCSHRLSHVSHKRCHCLWPFVHKCFLPEPLCHWRRNVVPWVKMEKENFIEACRW